MTLPSNHSTSPVSEFFLICFPNFQNWQHWLSLPLSLLFLLAMGANASLHQPLYYLLSLLSLLDIVLCLTVIPKVLAHLCLTSGRSSFPACFLQMFIHEQFLTMESVHSRSWPYDRYVASVSPYGTHLSSLINLWLGLPSLLWPGMAFLLCLSPYFLLNSDTVQDTLSRTASVLMSLPVCYRLDSSGSDLIFIVSSYFYLKTVLRIKALVLVVPTSFLSFSSHSPAGSGHHNLARKRIPPDVPILLNILHHSFPSSEPLVCVRNQGDQAGIQNLLRRL
uniref:G-protein coupled receptors family 1 profile domain-containing protein n=1 Tax=Aotus nancymaae TaxID=37293 RepID=A0A2K5DEN2_AOTNA